MQCSRQRGCACAQRLVSSLSSLAGDVVAPAHGRRTLPPPPPPPPPTASSFPRASPAEEEGFFRFEVLHESKRSRARVGVLHTPHGIVDTPGFVPVGTNAALKAVDLAHADGLGAQLVFCNTYHLLLQPGPATVEAAGGLHRFMARRTRPLITDSGGFQVFSLQAAASSVPDCSLKRVAPRNTAGTGLVRVSEEGALFKSYRDGARLLLTPESSVATQKALGADIILPLDELPAYHVTPEVLSASTQRSHRWMARSLGAHLAAPQLQAMYGIVHGGTDVDLRRHSAEFLSALPFDGFAIGGALGRDRNEMVDMLAALMPALPRHKATHLLGIGDEASLRACVPLGVDTFDSAWPTRAGRHGDLLTSAGVLKLRSASFARAFRTPDERCSCPVCTTHTLAYLHHLHRAREPVLASLAALHNLAYTFGVMAMLRDDIMHDRV